MKIKISIENIDTTKNDELNEIIQMSGVKSIHNMSESQRDELLTQIAKMTVGELFNICTAVNVGEGSINILH